MKRNRDLELMYEVGCLRFVARNWVQFLHPNFQNVAEHTMRVSWIALIIANKEKKGNQEKILKMALVHDLPESRTGDVNYLSRQYTTRDEQSAAADIFEGTSLKDEYIKLFKEYEERKSIEAKIVKDADNLDVDFELQEQSVGGHLLKSAWAVNRNRIYNALFTKAAKKMWKDIQKSNPHDWHTFARNRYNAGDWKNLK